jgi:hypothetical protein
VADEGKTVNLALTDPDSNEVVPWTAPVYAGDFMLASQADRELIFCNPAGGHQSLTAPHLSNAVDDSVWATRRHGALYVTDGTDDTVDVVSGGFTVGQMYSSVTPCDAANAPATCPAPGFPDNNLATTGMRTGMLTPVMLTPVMLTGAVPHSKGMIFVP